MFLLAGGACVGQPKAITVTFSCDENSQQAVLPPSISSIKGLVEFARRTFKQQA
jgi:hypothetical protein